ncbi:peptidylprolyl isomerase [Haliangium ochraceum]|uniref:peptidylprolyl isomerase n=1 Tax=Haliangium ochraceum TaxID=80816 RepID=UPI001E5F1617|nr:peptidylprolyl isomerase [Haliangium ochraceum]
MPLALSGVLVLGACSKKEETSAPAETDTTAPAEVDTATATEEPADDGRVAAPTADDLAEYTKDLEGEGPLMATIATTTGTFHCELFEKQVPMTVANFVGLARGLKPWRDPKTRAIKETPFYDGILFHRVIPNFMVQTGDPLGQGTGGPGYTFGDEIDKSLRHDKGGLLSMANAGPGTNGSQFFITEKATPWLDDKHAIFGQCDEVDLVKQMTSVPRDSADRPRTDIKIDSVTISRGR